jgi:hypothetical protein
LIRKHRLLQINVRCTPKATELLRGSEMMRLAKPGPRAKASALPSFTSKRNDLRFWAVR